MIQTTPPTDAGPQAAERTVEFFTAQIRNPHTRAPELSGPFPPVPAKVWDALATIATQQADQSRQSTKASAQRRPLPTRRDEAGRARYSEGRNAAADGATVDMPGS